jgi:hypothetical protein
MKKLLTLLALLWLAPANAQVPSPNNTRVPPAPLLSVPSISTWAFGAPDPASPGFYTILRDGVGLGAARASQLTYCTNAVYVLGRDNGWWLASYTLMGVNWTRVAALPCDTVVPPPPPPVCTVANTGGKFSLGDKVKVTTASGGWQMRPTPDISATALLPGQTPDSQGTVTCVQQVGTDQWAQIDFVAGTDGWAREGCCDKVGGVIVPPPPPPPPPDINPVPGASFYVSNAGDDANPGTLAAPFKTLAKAVPLLQPTNKLVVRQGTYDTAGFTKQGADTIFNTGLSWTQPIQIHAAPGEKVIFVRDPPLDSKFTWQQIRDGVHAPTLADCTYYNGLFPGLGLYLPWPDNCLSGGTMRGGLYELQDNTGATVGSLLDFVNATHAIAFVEFKDIVFDGRGMARNIWSSSTSVATGDATAHDFRFVNAEIMNSAGSCFAQPGGVEHNNKGEPVLSNISWIDSKLHHCGVPFDPNRRMSAFKYLHFLYADQGGNQMIRSECYENAGGCFEPSGPGNAIIDSYIHDNSCLGAQVGGGPGMVVRGTTFYNNGCGEVQALSEAGHTFEHNTIICGAANRALGLQITFRNSDIRNNIVTGCATSIYSLQPWDTANRITNNLIDGLLTIAPGTIAPVVSGTINAAPMLDAANVPLPGSPAIGKATDGTNIGAH